MKELSPSKLPYAGTKVNPRKTQGDISDLLNKFGINDIDWKEMGGVPQLAFRTEVNMEGRRRLLTVVINVPVFLERHRVWDEETRRSTVKEMPNLAQSMRILHGHLKSRLTIIAAGMVKFEEEFLADIAIGTPTGPRRLAEVIKERGLLALPETILDEEKKQ